MADRPTARLCRRCGGSLASDNPTDVCSPCQHAVATGRTEAPVLPDHFWDTPEVRKAVLARDFGQLVHAYRHAGQPVIKQSEMARWLGITQGQISRIERGETSVRDLDKLDRWARLLRIPQRCLWFSLLPRPVGTGPSDVNGDILASPVERERDDVRRRQFLTTASVSAATVGSSLLHAGGAAVALPGSGRAVGSPEVDLVREVTAAFRRVDNRYGGGHSRTAVISYLSNTVEPMLGNGRTRANVRDELFLATAELHQLAGWMAYDTGQANAGQDHLRTALRLCQEAGDDALSAEMLAGMSHHAAFHGAPASAVDLALAARQAAKRASRLLVDHWR